MKKTVEVKIQIPNPMGPLIEVKAEINFPLPDGRELIQGPLTYNGDGFATAHNADFLHDPLFSESYRLGMTSGHRFGDELQCEWRAYICCWAAMQVKNLVGDFVECGVNTGIYSRTVINYIAFDKASDKKFYLLDTFCGVPEEQWSKEEKAIGLARANDFYEDVYDKVAEYFNFFPNVILIKGKIPDTMPKVPSQKICYLSIDMNCAFPEVAALEYFWPKLVTGGVVILDDYGYRGFHCQKRAMDSFASAKGIQILALPTGQGLIIKN